MAEEGAFLHYNDNLQYFFSSKITKESSQFIIKWLFEYGVTQISDNYNA